MMARNMKLACTILIFCTCIGLVVGGEGCREFFKNMARQRISNLLTAFPELTDEIKNGQLGPRGNGNGNNNNNNNNGNGNGNNLPSGPNQTRPNNQGNLTPGPNNGPPLIQPPSGPNQNRRNNQGNLTPGPNNGPPLNQPSGQNGQNGQNTQDQTSNEIPSIPNTNRLRRIY